MKNIKSVDAYIEKNEKWHDALELLRGIIISPEVEETVKWGAPIYTVGGKNVLGLAGFKHHVAVWFFNGALLKDEQQKLINAQEGVTKALRQWRFENIEEIRRDESILRAYIEEAIANQRAGKTIKPQTGKPLIIPDELKEAFKNHSGLKDAFEQLSLSKKRDYAEYIATAKREETKQKRLDKIIPMILEGIGLHDKYVKK